MWVSFFLLGVLGAVAIWILQRQRWSLLLRAVLVAVVSLGIATVIYFQMPVKTLGRESWYNATPYRELLLFAVMGMGMIGRYVTRAIEERREALRKWQRSGGASPRPPIRFDAWEFSYPLFFSVVTFGALFSQVGDESLTLVNVTLSFQTGFFWQTVLPTKGGAKQ